MHIETQVALNFVISYLYNKLPRRRVNIFGEELEKALKDKFQGHWYPEKPFKGSAFRCLKTGDPIDQVLERAARESGVPIADILENLPNELSVWIDPGEVSYRIGEKGAVKILYSESNDAHEESSADREVTKTFNPEAQCFRPIEIVSTSLSNLSLSPKIAVNQEPTPPTFQASPMYNNPAATVPKNGLISPAVAAVQPIAAAPPAAGGGSASFLNRSQEPLTFTTATFAQTKFGSTKLKNSSKRTNRMSPTEFSNYLKQRAMQQQLHPPGMFGGTTSPSRSISPNSLGMGGNGGGDPYYFGMNMYPTFSGSPKNIFDNQSFTASTVNQSSSAEQILYGSGQQLSIHQSKCSSTMDSQSFNTIPPQNGANANGTTNTNTGNNGNANQNSNGMNNNPYQHLLVAN